jgi:hypothetical protein
MFVAINLFIFFLYLYLHVILNIIWISGINNLLFVFSQCMSPMRLSYRELGLKLLEIGEENSNMPNYPPMEKEKRDNGA